MRMLDDEELVGPLEQLVDRRAHRLLDDLDEMLGVDLTVGPDEERSLPSLVVGRERDELEDAVDRALSKSGLKKPFGGGSANETLRARARIDAPGLDTDNATHSVGRCSCDADQGRDLLRREVGDGRPALERILRLDAHLGAQRVLAL